MHLNQCFAQDMDLVTIPTGLCHETMGGSVGIAGLAFTSSCNIIIGDDDIAQNMEILTCMMFDKFVGLICLRNPKGLSDVPGIRYTVSVML